MNGKRIYIVGCGKAGSAFAFELSSAGYDVGFVTDRNEHKRSLIAEKLISVKSSSEPEREFVQASDVILMCVQDRNIPDAVTQIVQTGADIAGKIFLHCSGSETSEVFEKAGINPELAASVHPIQTFMEGSTEDKSLLKGIYFGLEGGEHALNFSKEMVTSLGSNYMLIPKEKKVLYHAACVVTSNFLVTMLNVAAELTANAGVEKSEMFTIFRPIIEKTIANVAENGLVNSLTGPFERNDVQTISKHLDSISSELPSLIPFYTLLGMETVRVAFRKESLNMKNVIRILDLMNEYVVNEQKLTQALNRE